MFQASLYFFSIVYSNVLPIVLQRPHVIAVTLLVSKAEGPLINRPLVHYRIGIQLPDTECLNPCSHICLQCGFVCLKHEMKWIPIWYTQLHRRSGCIWKVETSATTMMDDWPNTVGTNPFLNRDSLAFPVDLYDLCLSYDSWNGMFYIARLGFYVFTIPFSREVQTCTFFRLSTVNFLAYRTRLYCEVRIDYYPKENKTTRGVQIE